MNPSNGNSAQKSEGLTLAFGNARSNASGGLGMSAATANITAKYAAHGGRVMVFDVGSSFEEIADLFTATGDPR